MSNHSTSYTSADGDGQPPITKLIDLSESDHVKGAIQLPANFPNIRRKKKVSKAERDRLLQTFEERSAYNHVNEVDLGFLERKRIVLKKKQELLNKTLLANKINKQQPKSNIVDPVPAKSEQENKPSRLPVHRETDLEKLDNKNKVLDKSTTKDAPVSPDDGLQSKKQQQQKLPILVDQNLQRTTSLPNETKTTINFNIYNAEVDPFKSKGETNDKLYKPPPPSPMVKDKDKCFSDRPPLHKSQSINMETDGCEKNFDQEKDAFEKEAEKKSMSYLRSVLCCQTLFSIVIYVILFTLIAVSVFLAFKSFHITKMFAHHQHLHHNKNLHESKKKTVISHNGTTLLGNSTVSNNITVHHNIKELTELVNKSNNDYNLQDFFATLSNATIEKLKEQQQQQQLQRQGNTTSTISTAKNQNEKRQNIPGVPLIRVLISSTQPTLVTTKVGTTPKPLLLPATTTTTATSTSTNSSPHTSGISTVSTTTQNPYIEAAKSVLASLNINGQQPQIQQQQSPGFNAGSIDLGDSTTEKQNSPSAASMDQLPTYSSTSPNFQQQYYTRQPPAGIDNQNMFMDQSSLPQQQWNYDSNNNREYYDQGRNDAADGRSSIRQYDYSPEQENQDNGYRNYIDDDRQNNLRSLDPFKDSDEENRQQDDSMDWKRRRSDTREDGNDIQTTSTTTTTKTTTTTSTTTTSTTPKPPPQPQPLPPSVPPTISPSTTQIPSLQISPNSQRPLVIAENVEQYMSPRILSRDPLENMDRNIHSDAVFTDEKQMEDDGEDDENDEENEYHLSHQHKNFIPTRHIRGNDYREVENEEIKPFDKEMGSKDKEDDDVDDVPNDSRPHNRHLIPVVHKDGLDDDDDLKITVSKLKDSLADDLKDIKKKFSRLSQNKELEGVEKMIKILHHDDPSDSDQTTKSFHDLAKDDDVIRKNLDGPSDDMMTTLQQQNRKPDETGKNIMSMMLSEEKKLQSKDKSTPDLMSEFVAFEKSKTQKESSPKKRKNIPKKKKQPVRKAQVKTYKLKTCVQIKSFGPGVLVQIVKGPVNSNGKIRYDVRTCTRKRKKRQTKMTCEDITYRISTGKLTVKPVGWENAKKIFAVFGCKNDGNEGSMLLNSKSGEEDEDDNDMMIGGDTNDGRHNDDGEGDGGDDSSGSGSDVDDGDDEEDNHENLDDRNNDGPLTVDVMKETSPKASSSSSGKKKDGKQMNDLMHMVKDMKNEIKKQGKTEKKLVEKVNHIKMKKKSSISDEDEEDEEVRSDDLMENRKQKKSQETRKNDIEDSDIEDSDDTDNDNDHDYDTDTNHRMNHKHQTEKRGHQKSRIGRRNHVKHREDDGENDSDESNNNDSDDDTDDDGDGDNDDDDAVNNKSYSKKRHRHRDRDRDSFDDDDNKKSLRKRYKVNRDDEDENEEESEDEENPRSRRRSKKQTSLRKHHKKKNDSDQDEDEDNDDQYENQKDRHQQQHSRANRTPLYDNDDDDEHDEDFMRHQHQQQIMDDDDGGDDGDNDDDNENKKRSDRSTIPYNSHIREMEEEQSQKSPSDSEEDEENTKSDENEEDGEDEEDETKDDTEATPNDEATHRTTSEMVGIHHGFQQQRQDYQVNRDNDDPPDRMVLMSQHGTSSEFPELNNQVIGDQAPNPPQAPPEMVFNGVSYIIKDPRYDTTGNPNQITYNGIQYVAKYTNNDVIHQGNNDFQRFADDNDEDGYMVGNMATSELAQTTPSPFEMFSSFSTTQQPISNNAANNNNNNIADVIKAILPEVLRTVKEASTSDNKKEKRDSIPTVAPSTTTTTTTTVATTSTTTSMHPKPIEVVGPSAINLILDGLKALGVNQKRNKEHEEQQQSKPHPTPTPPPPPHTPPPPPPPPPPPLPPPPPPPQKPHTTTTPKVIHYPPPIPNLVNLHDPRQLRILCFGDSLTAGYNKHGKNFYPYCSPLGNIMRYHSPLNIYTEAKGIVGEMAHKQMTHRLPMVLGNATSQYDWIIILGGTNDILHVKNFGDDDEFLNQLENIWQPRITKDIERLHEIAYGYGAHTVLLTVPENSIEEWPEYHPLLKMREKINESLRDFAYGSNGRTVLCDLAKKVPRHSLTPVMENLIWDDHLHMTPQGYTKMAQAVFDCLRPYLPNTNK